MTHIKSLYLQQRRLKKELEAIALLFHYFLFSLTKISNIKTRTKNGHQTRPQVGFLKTALLIVK